MERNILKIKDDGNSLFRAISYCIYNTEERHREIRLATVLKIVNEWDYYGDFVGYLSAEDYQNFLSTDGEYGGSVELMCISDLFPNYLFRVNYVNSSDTVDFGRGNTVYNLLFSGNYNQGHFDVLEHTLFSKKKKYKRKKSLTGRRESRAKRVRNQINYSCNAHYKRAMSNYFSHFAHYRCAMPNSSTDFTSYNLGTSYSSQTEEPQYIISDKIEIEDFPIDPELSSSIAISEAPIPGIKSKVKGVGTEIEQQTTEGVVIKKEVDDDELEQQTTEGVVIKKEVDESLIGDATEIAHESSRPKDNETSIPKSQLNQVHTYIHTSRKEEVDILKKLTLPSEQQKILKNYVTEKEEELSKLKKELQGACKLISSLQSKKNAWQNNIADSVTDRICQDAFKLRFFTGLNSTKDFQWLRNLLHNFDTTATGVSVSSQLLIVLMRLQLNLQYPDLADRFGTSTDAIRGICDSVIPLLNSKLKLVLEGLSPLNVFTQPTEHVSHSYSNTVFVKLYKTIQRYTESVTEQCTNVHVNVHDFSNVPVL